MPPRGAKRYQPCRGPGKRSFAVLAARFPASPSGDLFLGLAQGEGIALTHLGGFAAALGLDPPAIAAYEPRAGCQAYPAYVAWLALNGSRSQAAMAVLANLDAWGSYCARMADALRCHYGLGDETVAFLTSSRPRRPGSWSSASRWSRAASTRGRPPRPAGGPPASCSPTRLSSGTRSPRGSLEGFEP